MKLPAIVLTILGGAAAMLSWSQTWFRLELVAGAGAGSGDGAIQVGGADASPALAALGLAALALAAAFALAGPGLRFVLAVLEFLLGGCVLLAAGLTLGDPAAAVAPAVTAATGVAGADPTAALIAVVQPTAWPVVAFLGGALILAAAVLVFATGAKWPSSSRRYGGAKLRPADASSSAGADRAVEEWDELTRGDDPTDDVDVPADESADRRDARPERGGDEPAADAR